MSVMAMIIPVDIPSQIQNSKSCPYWWHKQTTNVGINLEDQEREKQTITFGLVNPMLMLHHMKIKKTAQK